MVLCPVPKVCVFLLATYLSTGVSASSSDGLTTSRVLRAATKKSDFARRSMRITPRFENELAYIESENGWSGSPIFASQVKLGSEVPILHLEEIEHHLQDVQCGEGTMKLHFVDMVSARDAKASCSGPNGGRIITSHNGCNTEGERSVYKVNDATLSADEHILELAVVESTWKDAFKRFDITFGYTADDHLFRRHSDFERIRRRQDFDIPTDTPEDVISQSFDVSLSLIDAPFGLPAFVTDLVPFPSIPIDLRCKECSTTGTVVLTQGAININLTEIADIVPDNESFITGGFFELAANDLSAHIELIAKPIHSDKFTVSLPGVPIQGFVIPGIGEAGVTFDHSLEVSYDITESIEVTYGFEVVVPSPSTIRLELTDFAKSSVVGFADTKLTPLPFNANITDINILLGAAYLPNIPIGFKFLDQLTAQVKVGMDLPRLDLRLTTRDGVDEQCKPVVDLPGVFSELGPLVLAEANVSVSLDVAADFKFLLLPLVPAFDPAVNIFETTFQLLPSCLAADKGFVPVSQVLAIATGLGNYTPAATTVLGNYTPAATTVLGNYTPAATTAAISTSTPCPTSTVGVTHSQTYVSTATPIPISSSAIAKYSSVIEGSGYSAPPAPYSPPASVTSHFTVAPNETGGYSAPPAPYSPPASVTSHFTVIPNETGGYSAPPAPYSPPASVTSHFTVTPNETGGYSAPPAPYLPPANATSQKTLATSGTGGYTIPTNSPVEFPGAATREFVPSLNWSASGWQIMVLGMGLVGGAMMTL
ncbi:hypothetical protein K504DRAFT_532002 [Pleomassaria siparia CBS 279.74]|uniref:DUF7029 domain-containing protein n=1 Tax=Pleomassaria siparia CBS 279.74 TaxID=1314801 RepID=A0A6G1KF55_9PLEO|nr:hypothetical protein K504DRAFT_532002 [Pleomassaria siparia CBS 279.74]